MSTTAAPPNGPLHRQSSPKMPTPSAQQQMPPGCACTRPHMPRRHLKRPQTPPPQYPRSTCLAHTGNTHTRQRAIDVRLRARAHVHGRGQRAGRATHQCCCTYPAACGEAPAGGEVQGRGPPLVHARSTSTTLQHVRGPGPGDSGGGGGGGGGDSNGGDRGGGDGGGDCGAAEGGCGDSGDGGGGEGWCRDGTAAPKAAGMAAMATAAMAAMAAAAMAAAEHCSCPCPAAAPLLRCVAAAPTLLRARAVA